MTNRILIGAVLCKLLIADSAFPAVNVTGHNGAGLSFSYYTKQVLPNGHYVIHLLEHYAAPGISVYEIHANGGEIIDTISIDVPHEGTGEPVVVRVESDSPSGVGALGSIFQTGTAYTLLNLVESNGDLGSALANGIGVIEVGGNITGDIVAPTAAGGGITGVTADGNILGDIMAPLSKIGSVTAFGSIGTSSAPVTIEAEHGITQIISINDLYANIRVTGTGMSGTSTAGDIAIVQAQRFFGSLAAAEMVVSPAVGQGYVKVFTDLSADIELRKSFSGTNLFMELPLNGLTSQITINSDNLANRTWTAPIKIGPDGNPNQVILSSPSYPQTASSLGGGAVGLVPFRLHDESCVPVNDGYALTESGNPPAVRLRHYGPLLWTSGLPATIGSRPACTTGGFSPVFPEPTSADFALDDDNPSGTDPLRTLVVTYDFQPGMQYEITPTADLKCDGAVGNPPVDWDDDPYTFTVVDECYADINDSGMVDVDDLIAVILAWGACEAPPEPCPADIASLPCVNGAVDVDDLVAVILGWGHNCTTFTFEDVGSLQSVQDCMDKASLTFEPYSAQWDQTVQRCINGLCEAGIIECDD